MQPIFETILGRRSCRAFATKPIHPEDLQTLITAGIYAPSGRNRQTRQFTVLRSQENIQALATAVGAALGRRDYDFYKPVILVLVSDEEASPLGGYDCACALQNMFLMAHALGIGSCWINQLKDAQGDPAVQELLANYGLPRTHVVHGAAALGYSTLPPKTVDKSAQVVHFVEEWE